jgi:lysophospholipid acyltransferase (LPLAT)-like uncharacterized protein
VSTSWSASLAATLATAAIRSLTPTLRWHITGLEAWQTGSVLTLWHGQIVLGAALLQHLGRAAECWAVVVPEYGQSAAMSGWARGLGIQVALVPGYEQPAARRAALGALIPRLQAGQSIILPADGHRPPAEQVRPDAGWLATAAQVPLLAIALSARPALTLPTWDRKPIPLPASHIGVAVATLTAPAALKQHLIELTIQARHLAHQR